MLAALDPNAPQWVGAVALAVFALVGGLNQLESWLARRRGEPPSEVLKASADVMGQRVLQLERDIKEASENLKRAGQFDHRINTLEHDQREAILRRRAIHDRVDRVQHELREEIKEAVTAIYDRVNALSATAATLQSNDEHQNRQLAHIEAKLDRFIEANRK